MNLAPRSRLFLAFAGVIVVFALALDALVAGSVDHERSAQAQAQLVREVDLLSERAALQPLNLSDHLSWEAFASLLSKRAGARVTFFARDGHLLGDSALRLSRLASTAAPERPEVKEALASGHGVLERASSTDGAPTIFAAAPFLSGGTVAGVVRVGRPVEELATAADVQGLFALTTLLALLAAFGLATFLTRHLSPSLVPLSDAVRKMALGDFTTRVRGFGSDALEGHGHDLDQLRRAVSESLKTMQEERDLLGRVLDGMAEGVLLVDGEGTVALVNPALREMLLLGADVLGRIPLEVVRHPELHELLERSRLKHSVESGEVELSGLKPRRLLVRVLPLSGEPAAQLAVFVDVTDLRRLESLRRDFVANVSHELRTPVTSVQSAAETLREAVAKAPAAVPMFLDIIVRNAERLRQLVEDLLDLSRIDAREYKLDLEPLDSAQAMEQALALFRERAAKKRIRLSSQAPPGLKLVADRRALEQILANLLENGIKYCGEGAEIRVRCEPEGERMVKVAVQDTGPGIDAAHLPRVFERFYRVDKGRSRDVGGTGLGLSIVKNLAEAMGGSVSVASAPGQGATFVVTLPAG